MVEEVSSSNFEQEVLKSDIPVVADFWAPWCGPCRMQAPVIEKMSDTHKDKVKFVKVNTDENQQIATDYGITGIPTLIVFKGGSQVKKLVGFQSEAQLTEEIKSL